MSNVWHGKQQNSLDSFSLSCIDDCLNQRKDCEVQVKVHYDCSPNASISSNTRNSANCIRLCIFPALCSSRLGIRTPTRSSRPSNLLSAQPHTNEKRKQPRGIDEFLHRIKCKQRTKHHMKNRGMHAQVNKNNAYPK